jgi:phage terminase small subunit
MAAVEVELHTLIPRWRAQRGHLVSNLHVGANTFAHGARMLNAVTPLAAERPADNSQTTSVDGEVEWTVDNIDAVKKQVTEVGKKYVEVFRQFQTISNPKPPKDLYEIYHDVWRANVKFRDAHQLTTEISKGLLAYASDMYDVILPSLVDPTASDQDVHELLTELTQSARDQQTKLNATIQRFSDLKDDLVTLVASIGQKTTQLAADKQQEKDRLEKVVLPTLIAERDSAYDKWKAFMGAAIGVSLGLAIISVAAACFIPPGTGSLVAALGTTAGRVAAGAAVGSVTAAGILGSQASSARSEYEDKANEVVETERKIRDLNDNISTFDALVKTLNEIKPVVQVMSASIQDTEQLWRNVSLQNDLILEKFGKASERHGIAFKNTINSCLPLFKLLKEVMGVYITSFAADPGVVNEPIRQD